MRAQRASVAGACFGWFFAAVDPVLPILFLTQVPDAGGREIQAVEAGSLLAGDGT